MKKFTLKALAIAALFTVNNCLIAMMPAVEAYKIYIENHYGAPIKFKKAAPQESAEETSVANMQRVLVDDGYKVRKLSIRTTGAGSSYLSPFTDLAKEIRQIDDQSNLDVNLYKNAVIIIKPSKSYENWNIQIHWEAKISTEEMSPEEEMITAIMNGSLGPNYAQKVAAISSAPKLLYDLAESDGNPNLNDLLSAHVRTFIIKNDNPSSQKLYEENLKNTIDALYAQLLKYESRYFVKK
jgi:hypothetical protein